MQIENLNNPVSKNVLRIIKEKGMKQCVVAERAGYSRSALNNMLNGRKVMKICDVVCNICNTNTLFTCVLRHDAT